MPQKMYLVDLTYAEKHESEKLLEGGTHQSRRLTRAGTLSLANAGKTNDQIVKILQFKVLQTARPTNGD